MDKNQERPEDQLERMLAEHAAGIPSSQDPQFDPLLSAAAKLHDAGRAAPQPAARDRAFLRMLNQVESEHMKTKSGRFAGFWSSLVSRPVAGTAMTAAVALVVVSGLGIGVATATGADQPVRSLLGISRSTGNVQFTGVITAINGSEITVDGGDLLHVITTNASTRIKEHGDTVDASRLAVGTTVEIHAQTQADGSVLALTIGIEDDVAGSPTAGAATPGAATPSSATPVGAPTVDDHGGDRPRDESDDNSGPGSSDDSNDDNSGPGSGDDSNDDNSGSGSSDDLNDDNSGSGSSDDSNDDNSGSGSSDDSNDDNSGSGSSDDSNDDNSGSGSSDGSNDDNSGSGSSDDSDDDSSGHGGDDN